MQVLFEQEKQHEIQAEDLHDVMMMTRRKANVRD